MTERERLLTVLRGGTPDRTPWYGDLSWWYAAHRCRGTLPEPLDSPEEGYLALHRSSGVGIYLYAPMLWREEYDDTVRVQTRHEGRHLITVVETPVGTVRSVQEELPDSQTHAYREHFVKGKADLPVLRYMATHRCIVPNVGSFEECDRLWGDAGLAVVLAPICAAPLQSFLTRLAGVETTVELLYSENTRDELVETFHVLEEADDPIFQLLAAGPGVVVEFPENLSAEVTGARLIREFLMPYWARRIEQLHAAGKYVGIHNDGTLRGSLNLLIQAGFDFVESVTPAPVGDMSMEEMRKVADGRIVLWGGLPGAVFSPQYSEETFVGTVNAALDAFPDRSGFVLGVADQVPPDAPYERICRVRELVEAHASAG